MCLSRVGHTRFEARGHVEHEFQLIDLPAKRHTDTVRAEIIVKIFSATFEFVSPCVSEHFILLVGGKPSAALLTSYSILLYKLYFLPQRPNYEFLCNRRSCWDGEF